MMGMDFEKIKVGVIGCGNIEKAYTGHFPKQGQNRPGLGMIIMKGPGIQGFIWL